MEEKWIMYPKCLKNSGSIEAGCLQEILRKGSGGSGGVFISGSAIYGRIKMKRSEEGEEDIHEF